jgi:F-type H+-transporting ATPase subunit delta
MLSASRGSERIRSASKCHHGINRLYRVPVLGSRPSNERTRVADDAHNSSIVGRYATAIFDLAVELKALDAVASDFAALKRMMAASSDLARLVRAPIFGRNEQKKGLEALLGEMGASSLTIRFIALLAAKRRLFVLADIIAAFDAMVARRRGEMRAEVTSARALKDGEIEELKRVLKDRLKRDAIVETHVDPTLLGGLIVKVGSRMIDSSLRTKLNGMRAAMRGN